MIRNILDSGFAALRKMRAERALVVFQSLLAAFAITPFGLWRLSRGEWAQGLFDVGLVALLLSMAWLARKERWTRVVTRVVASAYIVASVVVTHQFGVLGQFWFFPAVVAAFFVVRSGEAFALAALGLVAQLWLVAAEFSLDARSATFLVTSLLVAVFVYAFSNRLRLDNTQLYIDSTVDSLTGAANRRQLDDTLAGLTQSESKAALSLLMLDVDHFKSINDRFGHETGDLCLKRLTERLQSRLGPARKLYRSGGEEFVVLVDASLDQARALAETLRLTVAENALIREDRVTISVGVAERRPMESARDWMRRADDAMYAAKKLGRNRVQVAT